jgi:exo-beta-1,3-glucanase (GH17 family)
MRLYILPLLLTPLASAWHSGFNIGAQNPDGSCKTTSDWATAFTRLSALPNGGYRSARLFASSDCGTLAAAVPAALRTKTKLLAGVWAEDDAHFGAEKAALEAAVKKYGGGWLLGVSVGSEDLYRGDTDAGTLAGKVYDVRGMLRGLKVEVPVGHTDTWTAW